MPDGVAIVSPSAEQRNVYAAPDRITLANESMDHSTVDQFKCAETERSGNSGEKATDRA
jgi:hypothetical protein